MSKKVTWLLPVRNGMPFLPETLASIEAQTYPDWEILAWDNGSTDGTVETLHEWIPSRLPGRVVTDQPTGLGASLALMMNAVETEFCARIDADDVNLPDRLEKQMAFLAAHPEIAAVGAQANRIDAEGQEYGPFVVRPTRHDDIVHWMLFRNPMIHPAMTFRRSAVLEAGNYRDVGRINIEDMDLWLRLAVRHKLANLDDFLLKYRVHDGSTTSMAIVENRLQEAVLVRFVEHGPALFGCTPEDAELLRSNRHPYALQPLQTIAKHLEQTQGGDRMKSKSFLTSAQKLVQPKDYVSRFFLLNRLGGPGAVAAEIGKIFGRAGRKLVRAAPRSPVGTAESGGIAR